MIELSELKCDIKYDILFERKDFLDKELITILPLSDLHIGNPLYNEDYLKRVINYIGENDHVYTFLNGDIIENVTRLSKGEIYQAQPADPDDQLEQAIQLLSPIKGKILSVTKGNHENRNDGHDFNRELARCLGVSAYHPIGILLELRIGQKKNKKPHVFTLYHTHGSGGGATKGGKINKLCKYARQVISDVVVVSHMHDKIATSMFYAIPDKHNLNIITKEQKCVIIPAMLDFGGYGMKYGYEPTGLGVTLINFFGKGKGATSVITI